MATTLSELDATQIIKAALTSGSVKLRGPASPQPERDGKHDAAYLLALFNKLIGDPPGNDAP